jgi:hypothetical protein
VSNFLYQHLQTSSSSHGSHCMIPFGNKIQHQLTLSISSNSIHSTDISFLFLVLCPVFLHLFHIISYSVVS